MKIITHISNDVFNVQTFREAAVIDSGFSLSANTQTTLHTNNTPNHHHGSQVLHIFSYKNPLHFHLSTIDFNDENPVLQALQALPEHLPILNLSLIWKDHIPAVYDMLFTKFQYIVCAYKENTYPTLYKPSHPDNIITVSNNTNDINADYVIPIPKVFNLTGNSAVTPIISNLLSHTPDFHTFNTNMSHVQTIFQSYTETNKINQINNNPYITCPNCGYVNRKTKNSCEMCNHILKR